MSDRIRVLVADDHPLFRSAVVDAIGRSPDLDVVATVDNGRGALDEIRRLQPDVALLDRRMPDLNADQVLEALRREPVATRVVVLSAYTDGSAAYDLLARGAAGYVDKGSSAQQICDMIIRVSQGHAALSQGIEGGVLREIRRRGEDGARKLSPREHEVLKLIAEGLSGPDIAACLYIEASTVKSHLHNLYEKLGVSERAAAVAEGMRRGLLE